MKPGDPPTYRVVIRGEDYEHVVGTGKTLNAAERVADGVAINLDHERFAVSVEEEA